MVKIECVISNKKDEEVFKFRLAFIDVEYKYKEEIMQAIDGERLYNKTDFDFSGGIIYRS